jgi:phage tail-like protein
MPTMAAGTVISAPRFLVQPVGGGKPAWAFTEMNNIAVEVEPATYQYCDSSGAIVHSKNFGATKPPTVTLKKPMDTDKTLWMWHMSVQMGNPMSCLDCTLQVFGPGSPGVPPMGKPVFTWLLMSAWPNKIEVAGMKAGSTQTGELTVTFACDVIEVLDTSGNPSGAAFSA